MIFQVLVVFTENIGLKEEKHVILQIKHIFLFMKNQKDLK